MSSGPCLCSCEGNGRGHRCRSPVDDTEEPSEPGGRTSYEKFTYSLDSALHRLQQTYSPPKRTPQYTLFLRGCLEFEPVTSPGFWSQSSSGVSTPGETTASSVSESQTPEEQQSPKLHPRIADSGTLEELDPDVAVASIEDDMAWNKSSGLHDLFQRNTRLSTPTATERIRTRSGSRRRQGSRSPSTVHPGCVSAPGSSGRVTRVRRQPRRSFTADSYRKQPSYIAVAH